MDGREIACLDPCIKNYLYYKKIFGENREFQVLTSKNPGYLRTCKNVNHQFKINEEETKVFFEFAEDGK